MIIVFRRRVCGHHRVLVVPFVVGYVMVAADRCRRKPMIKCYQLI